MKNTKNGLVIAPAFNYLASILTAALAILPPLAYADHNDAIELDDINVTGTVDSRIIKHPATVETYTRAQIQESVNATTSQQTLKYLPSFQVRERYIGDRNGPLATRTTGTLSSAQTMVYADGILLSNLLGNSFSFPPRWGMVSPEEIESVSILYGPFSALYAGNSFGGVVSMNTRMPTKFEAHATAQAFAQHFELYGTDKTFRGNHETASVGDKVNDLSFWLGVDRLENESQPMQFANALRSTTAPGGSPIVTGAYLDRNERNQDRVTFGTTGKDSTEQLNVKLKAAYDISPTVRATYTLGLWDLDSRTDVDSYIRDAAGNPVYNGRVNFNGQRYDVTGFSPAKVESFHVMQAIDLKSNGKGFFDWNLTLSDYDYQKDKNSSANAPSTGTTANGNPYLNRTGRVTDMNGTGWTVLDARATLRPTDGHGDKHEIDVGYHVDRYTLKSDTNNTADWSTGNKGSLNASSQGQTQTHAVYAQDKWQLNPAWAVTLGGRFEHWEASDGSNQTTTGAGLQTSRYADKTDNKFSPKLSISFEPVPEWGFRAAFGQAFRFPTVSELYQQLTTGTALIQNNPDLKTEEVISTELTAERRFSTGLVRASFFHENKYDALVSQTTTNGNPVPFGTGTCTAGAAGCTFIQNIDHVRTYGLELASEWQDVVVHGLDLMGSATFTHAEIVENEANPQFEGNKPLRIPRAMFKGVATYHQGSDISYSLAARYSGRQYFYLDNSDSNPDVFGGASKFFIMDVKANYKFAKRWTASVGVDNLNNYKAYIFHPYPQRTGYVQVRFNY
ncbi:MAG: TonB-dependent receptor [Methylophilus sp.]|nr:TonB-dependent receptor [Methylophilus sp.]